MSPNRKLSRILIVIKQSELHLFMKMLSLKMSSFIIIPFIFFLCCYGETLDRIDSTVELLKKKVDHLNWKIDVIKDESQKHQEKNTKMLENFEKILSGLAGITKRVENQLQELSSSGQSRIEDSLSENLKTSLLEKVEDVLVANLEAQSELLKNDFTKKINSLPIKITEAFEAICVKEIAKITEKLSDTQLCLTPSSTQLQNEDNVSHHSIEYTSQKFRSCSELQQFGGYSTSGVYEITPETFEHSLKVYCDFQTDEGGWTVIQRRDYYSKPWENFDRPWNDYKQGFGDPEKEFWIGNDALHILTKQNVVILRIELVNIKGSEGFGEFSGFYIDSEQNKYRLNIKTLIKGNIGSPIKSSDGIFFSTNNVDNDMDMKRSCSKEFHGGWWFSACGSAYLNGAHEVSDDSNGGIMWQGWTTEDRITKVELKIRSELFQKVERID